MKILLQFLGLPRWLSSKESTCSAGDTVLVPGSGRSPGGGNGNPLQYSCWDNPMVRGVWWATVHKVAKSRMQLDLWHTRKQVCGPQLWKKGHIGLLRQVPGKIVDKSARQPVQQFLHLFPFACCLHLPSQKSIFPLCLQHSLLFGVAL